MSVDAPGTLAMMAYRSRAAFSPHQADLDRLLLAAQRRNRREGLTGLLIYDQGCFFQWLEGPPAALRRVWDSIRRDPRHLDVEILREQPLQKRFFGGWDMRLARRVSGAIDAALPLVEVPSELLKRLRVQTSGWTAATWDQLFSHVVIPSVKATRPGNHPSREGTAFIWHARQDDGTELAGALRAENEGATADFVDHLVDQGAEVESLYHEVFEPAVRFLGQLYDDDALSDFDVTLVLSRLQVEVRRLSATLSRAPRPVQPGHSILVAPHPGEAHGIGAAMTSELFRLNGWNVNCEFPTDAADLRALVSENWYDVLDITLSQSVRRDRQLQAVRAEIRAARTASLNPALAVIVEGRSFRECTGAYVSVGADAGCATVVDAVPVAQRLLDGIESLNHTRLPQTAVGL